MYGVGSTQVVPVSKCISRKLKTIKEDNKDRKTQANC